MNITTPNKNENQEQRNFHLQSIEKMRKRKAEENSKRINFVFVLRQILNILFILLVVIAIIIYFTKTNSSLYIYIIGGAVIVKMFESILRLLKK